MNTHIANPDVVLIGSGVMSANLGALLKRLEWTVIRKLDGVLQGVTPVWTLDGTRHLARHIKAGHLRDGWRPSIAHLRGRDGSWTTLLSLYDEAQTCERCAQTRPATVAHKPAVKTVENSAKPRLPPEEIRARALKVIEEIQQRKGKK